MPLKFGWLPRRYGIFLSLAALATAPAQSPRILFAGGGWAAIDFGERCEARSKALWARKGTTPFAGFAFERDGKRRGQFYVHLSRPARTGASVVAKVGSQPFLLIGRGQWAWSRNAAQQAALLTAARYGAALRVESRDSSGRRIVDFYEVGGAATAIDAAAAACAGKSA